MVRFQKLRQRVRKQPLNQGDMTRHLGKPGLPEFALLKSGAPCFREPFEGIEAVDGRLGLAGNGADRLTRGDAKFKNQAFRGCLRERRQQQFHARAMAWNASQVGVPILCGLKRRHQMGERFRVVTERVSSEHGVIDVRRQLRCGRVRRFRGWLNRRARPSARQQLSGVTGELLRLADQPWRNAVETRHHQRAATLLKGGQFVVHQFSGKYHGRVIPNAESFQQRVHFFGR